MRQLLDNRKALVAIAIVVAFVAVVVPTCRMVGCQMEMGYMGFMHPGDTAGLFSDCGGTWSLSDTPVGIIPASIDALVLALFAAISAVVAMLRPQMVAHPVRIVDAAPPPPPEEPLGARFRV